MDEGAVKNDSEINENEDNGRVEETSSHVNIPQLLSIISSLVKQRKHSEALEECNKGLKPEPHHEKLLEKKIKVLCQLGQFYEAYDLASDWSRRQPEHPTAKKEVNRLTVVLAALDGNESDEDDNNNDTQDVNLESIPFSTTLQSENDRVTSNHDSIESTENENDLQTDCVASDKEENLLPDSFSSENNCILNNLQNSEDDFDEFECTFCDIKFNKKEELETHCRSDLHKKRLTSDEGQDWKFRPPPRGLSSEEYSLCQRFADNGRCSFGVKCTEAHSEDELNEWKERFKFRREQLQKAREKLLHGNSFTEKLMERLMLSENPRAILVQSLDFVKLHINADLKVTMPNKRSTFAWTFTVTSKMSLHNVCLLDDVNKSYFYISSISVGPKKTQKYQNLENHCQEWYNPDLSGKSHGEYVYRVKVVFKTDIFGTFRQSIIFDFGFETVLMREIQVESETDLDKLASDIIITEANRWTKDKVNITPFKVSLEYLSESDQNLLAKYSLPQAEKISRPDSAIMQILNKENYREWMHEMLYYEEMAQFSSISGFNIKTALQLVNRFLLMPGALSIAKYANYGELFAKMKLEDDLCEDSISGRLILQNAQFAYIALSKSNKEKSLPKKAYEVYIEDKGKNFIFLRLPKICVDELKLSCDEEVTVLVQFQLNRLPKVEMHAAVDKLPSMDTVFPTLEDYQSIPWSPSRQCDPELNVCKLNAKQKEAVLAITTDPDTSLPPLLIVGPFGTGKTYTLAQAAKQVLKQQDGSRILICTHSNSAGDLYIKDFFHAWFEEGNEGMKPLRIIYKNRWVQTVSETVLKYSLFDSHTSTFKYPTLEDLEKHRVIITTLNTARYISDLNISKGFFSHIFIDEAAQALECETLIPLSMTCESTRLVLAGDHMQLSPEVYADFCRQQDFQMSLLERLHEYYPHDHPCKIMLCENYRSHSAIVDFTSELFYENKLISSGKQKAHSKHYPLTFYAAKGEEVQHQNSTGFYNAAEVYEVVERVVDLQRKWLDEWGPMNDSSISIVTPYADQVKFIRNELRKQKLYHISVERVHNIQGKQFRVIILSTVRTQNTCRSDTSEEDLMDYGFLSNLKLLNTAITRAQSLVMVVGDPVSLCLVGKCRKVWEYFLEICNQHSSFYGMTWSTLRAQLEGVEMTKTYTLNPLAPEFIPNRMYHITKAASDSMGMNLQSQPIPSIPPWQQQMYGPSPYNHPMSNIHPYQMYQPMMPMPLPGYMSNIYHGRVMYKPQPTTGRSSPKSSRSASQLSSNNQKNNSKDAIRALEGRLHQTKQSRKMMMYMPQRFPMTYPPCYPMMPQYPGYYYIPEDARQMNPYLQPRPYHPHHGINERYYVGASASQSPRSDSDSDTTEARASPSATTSGQQIQLLPNVKHIPGHLSPIPHKAKSVKSTNKSGEQKRSPPIPHNQSEDRRLHVSDRPYSPANYTCERSSTPGSDSEQTTKPRPFSKNRGPFSQRERHPDSDESNSINDTLKVGRRGKNLTLKTGFSRQFSDDLPTPTEVKDIVLMMEESIAEEPSTQKQEFSENKKLEDKLSVRKGTRNNGTPPPKLHLNFTPPEMNQNKEVGSVGNGKLSYAGVLRKQPMPTLSPQPEGGAAGGDRLNSVEATTPRTPSGYVTPGTELDTDPFGILASLNIEHRGFQQF